MATAAALATLHVIERDGLLANAQEVGRRLALGAPQAGAPLVTAVDGEGLLLGLRLSRPRAKELAAAALESGFVVNAVTPSTVRLAPPLILTADQADSFLAALPQLVQTAELDEES